MLSKFIVATISGAAALAAVTASASADWVRSGGPQARGPADARSPVDVRNPADSRSAVDNGDDDNDDDNYRPRPPVNGGFGGGGWGGDGWNRSWGGGWSGGGWGGGWGNAGYGLPRVEAQISTAGDYGSFEQREQRARMRAIEAWQSRVAYRYGDRFSDWRPARDKFVNCMPYRGGFSCTVSARPARGWGVWHWNTGY